VILLVDLCYREDSLGFEEFVLPIRRIVESCGFSSREIHYTRNLPAEISRSEAVVLCGTPLADNQFLVDIRQFSWLPACPVPVLGICAGMEVLTLVHGGKLETCLEIGMTPVRVSGEDPLLGRAGEFPAYEVHGFGCRVPDDFRVLARSDRCVQVIQHESRPQWGVMFHPEVRNEWVVERFLALVSAKGS
jgi:GMP synthase-like glutamine amidotransferase